MSIKHLSVGRFVVVLVLAGATSSRTILPDFIPIQLEITDP